MHAGKIARSDAAAFVPPTHNSLAARLQGKQEFHNPGKLSPLMMRRSGSASARVLQEKQRQMQAKEQGNPAAAFEQGGGSSLSPALQAKYADLLAGNVDFGNVKVHTGHKVDNVLAGNGLQGLTDGKNVAVSSKAERGTLEHELGHVAQQQQPGFNLNEGSRGGYEQDADRIADSLAKGSLVDVGLSLGRATLQTKGSGDLQGKCKECERKNSKQGDTSLMGKKDRQAGVKGECSLTPSIDLSDYPFVECINQEMASMGLGAVIDGLIATGCFIWGIASIASSGTVGTPQFVVCAGSLALSYLAQLTIAYNNCKGKDGGPGDLVRDIFDHYWDCLNEPHTDDGNRPPMGFPAG